jgi:nicotinamidase-related amidase
MIGPEIDKSALIIVDMQNDFVHSEGGFAYIARETPEAGIDMPFLRGPSPIFNGSLTPFAPQDGRSSMSPRG